MFQFGESTRSTSPLSRGVLERKGGGKLSIHHCADLETITTVFRTITSVNQLSLFGAVAEMCEECESCHDRTGRDVVKGQSVGSTDNIREETHCKSSWRGKAHAHQR